MIYIKSDYMKQGTNEFRYNIDTPQSYIYYYKKILMHCK
jgi:hypothetical protein